MSDRLTTAEVVDRVSKLLPTAVNTRSALTLAGATSIDYDTDIVRRVDLGGPGLYREGERKQLSDTGIVDATVYKAKLVYILLYSTELARTRGEEYKSAQMAQVAAGLQRGADMAVLNGTDPRTGNARADLADINIKDNATQAVATTDFNADLIDVLKSTPKSTGLILSQAGYSNVAYELTSQGTPRYPNATKNGTFTFVGGDEAIFSDALGVNGWNSSTTFTNTNLAAAGPWNTVARSFSVPEVTASKDAVVGDVNLFLDNFEAYKVEQFISFVVPKVTDFTVLKSA